MSNAAGDWWSLGAAQALRQLARTRHRFHPDHLINLVGEPPHSAYVGAAFAAAQRSRLIEQVGCLVAADGRLVRVWRGLSQAGDW